MAVDLSDGGEAAVRAYGVGFLALGMAGEPLASSSAGSGTLVDFFGVKGILTAAHVARALLSRKEFGILRFGGGWLQALKATCTASDVVMLGGEDAGEKGPDIAFIRISPDLEATLLATNAFYSPVARGRAFLQGGPRGGGHVLFATGVVGEASKALTAEGNRERTEHTSIMGVGNIVGHDMGEGGNGSFLFKIIHGDGFPSPSSYGGMSGGGVWQLKSGDGVLNRTLIGVVFRETEADANGERSIICNGPAIIYDVMVLTVLDRFSPDLAAAYRAAEN